MGAYSTYYTPSMFPPSSMSVPLNTNFSVESPHIFPGVSQRENQFYSLGYPVYGTPSQGGNIYHHSNIPYHTSVSSQTLVMMLIHTSMNQLNGGYYLFGQGHRVNQDPSWPAMFQSQYFLGNWHQMPHLAAIPVTIIHTRDPSPTSVSYVGDESTTPASFVDNSCLVIASHAGSTTLITMSPINATSPTSVRHVGDDSHASSYHVESMSLSIVNNVLDIENPRCLRRKPKFLCRTCEGNYLTHLCTVTIGIQEALGSPKGPLDSEASVFSPHTAPPLINMVVTLLQSPLELTPVFEGDASPIPVDMHLHQPRIEEVVTPVQSLASPNLLMESDASFDHVVIILDPAPSEQERVFLSPSPLPLGFEEINFDWDSQMGYPISPPIYFPLRDIVRSITKTIYSVSALSSSTWRALGFPKLMSSIHKILTFHRRMV
jgi:hypothetical protein